MKNRFFPEQYELLALSLTTRLISRYELAVVEIIGVFVIRERGIPRDKAYHVQCSTNRSIKLVTSAKGILFHVLPSLMSTWT